MRVNCEVLASHPTIEGAGVRLRRAFGFAEAPRFDPFLLLDDFRSSNPADYLPGFPWHPHRGIETITIMLEGRVEHRDSLGNAGVIAAGDAQWMTAGSGIIHQEMPKGSKTGRLEGLQLWLNLPATHKMISPRYRDVPADRIPRIDTGSNAKARIIAGTLHGVQGPVRDAITQPEVFLVTIDAHGHFSHDASSERIVLAYVLDGALHTDPETDRRWVETGSLVSWSPGAAIRVEAEGRGARLLFLSARPLREPVAWRGPIVMNTEDELRTAFAEYRTGTFLRHSPPGERSTHVDQ